MYDALRTVRRRGWRSSSPPHPRATWPKPSLESSTGRNRCTNGEFLRETPSRKRRVMNRRGTVVTLAMTAVVAVGVGPAFATADKAKAKPLKGTFSYLDVTPDASITVFGTAGKRSG